MSQTIRELAHSVTESTPLHSDPERLAHQKLGMQLAGLAVMLMEIALALGVDVDHRP